MEKLNESAFDEIVYDNAEPCLVVFTRKSCHVCQGIHPRLEELATEEAYEGRFGFYEVDVEEQNSLFQRFSLKGVPQVLFFDEGNYKGKLVGDHDIDEYADKIDSILA